MAFRIKTFLEISGGMIAHMRAAQRSVTDFVIGAVGRTMLEAPSIEIDELYQMYSAGLVEGIPTAIYRSFQFELQPAKAASGVVRLYANPAHNAPITINAGFIVASASAQYVTAEIGLIPVGQEWVDVLAVCTTPGSPGNASPGEIRFLVSSQIGVVRVSNPAAIQNGRGMELEQERKLRFIDYVRSLAKGTIGACLYHARQAAIPGPNGLIYERVARAEVEETEGHVDMFIHNGVGNTSPELVAAADAQVQGYIDAITGAVTVGARPTGMRVDLHAMVEIPVPVLLHVEVPVNLRSEALRTRIRTALSSVILSTPNKGFLLPLSLQNAGLTVPGVLGAVLEAPALTIRCPLDGVLVPGGLDVRFV